MLLQIAASGTIAHILEFFFLIIWVGTIIVVITENRNPVKTLAWAMVLVFLPILGFVLYLLFGLDMRKEKIIGRRSWGNVFGNAKNGRYGPSVLLFMHETRLLTERQQASWPDGPSCGWPHSCA